MSLSRQQYTLIGLFALFFAPLILVMLMRSSYWDYRPAELKNNGQLVQPPLELAISEDLKGEWLLMYVAPEICEDDCLSSIAALRQIYKASGRQQEHLRVVVLNAAGTNPDLASKVSAIYPGIVFQHPASAGTLQALRSLNSQLQAESGNPAAVHTYILDPMQNVILAYTADTFPSDINKDLKRLLKWSKADEVQ